jgi:hypothetical protein
VEVHFTAGEALVCCAQGVMSPFARDVWTTLESEYEPHGLDVILAARNQDLQWLLDELLNKFAPDPHPNKRQVCMYTC